METTPISPQKKLYNYRRENGLCPKCGKPLDRKGFYCEECREKQTAYSRETRELKVLIDNYNDGLFTAEELVNQLYEETGIEHIKFK